MVNKMTEKLYSKNSYIKSFEACVLECKPFGDNFGIILDKTAFFPESGGQYADKGTIGGIEVLDVREENGEIYHILPKSIEIGEKIKGEIDFETRFIRMQNHSGEHLICGVLHNLFGAENVGFHLNDECATMDIDMILEERQLDEAELLANRAIYENRKINILFPTDEELEGIKFRAKLEKMDNIRIIEIEGIDKCACCAPHVNTTGEIGSIKIIGAYKLKKNIMRITIVCGKLALEDHKKLHSENAKLMSLLSAKREETAKETERVLEALNSCQNEIKELSRKLAFYELETSIIGTDAIGFLENKTYQDLSFCANKLLEENEKIGRVLLFSENGKNEFIYMILSETENVSEITKALNEAFRGRGGGKGNYSQGKLNCQKEMLIEYLKN